MGAVVATITSESNTMPPEYELLTIDVVKEVNRIPYAELKLVDGNAPQQQFPISDSDFFEPGNKVEIKLRYESKPSDEAVVFTGIVVKQAIRSDERGSFLMIELSDYAIKMTSIRRSMVYVEKSDDKIIEIILGTYPNVKIKKIDPLKPVHKETVQYYSTDWDYMLNRADVNGLITICDDGEVSVIKPVIGAAKHEANYGIDSIYDLEMEVSSEKQYAKVESSGWSIKDQKMTVAQAGSEFALKQGKLKGADLSKVVNPDPFELTTGIAETEEGLKAWADAMMIKSRLSMIRGRMTVYGNPLFKVGETIEIKGVGDKFNGTTLITGVRHRVNITGWFTDVQFGLPYSWFSEKKNIDEEPASGLMPAINGLHVGIVDAFKEDPDKHYRVRVKVPKFDDKDGIVWARLMLPDAGKERGAYFYPEKGDEVILGFINDDPRHAIILGSLHNDVNKPPFVTDAKNIEKGIVTKAGCKLVFNDDTKSITIQTSEKNIVFIDEKTKVIDMKDVNGNQVTLSDKGILLKSGKDIIIDAGGNVTIKGSKVDVK